MLLKLVKGNQVYFGVTDIQWRKSDVFEVKWQTENGRFVFQQSPVTFISAGLF